MRFPAVAVPVIILLGGALYFSGKAREIGEPNADARRFDQSAPAPTVDVSGDEYDRALVRQLLESTSLGESEATSLVSAAGRRYMRRKQAYAAAKMAAETGKSAGSELEPLRREMEVARKVCDVAESLGRRGQVSAVTAEAAWELERRLVYIPSSMAGLTERFDGASAFSNADLGVMEQAFLKHFGKPLPVSTRGQSAVHRAMGFDHRGRFDVAIGPSQPEGVWARRYLTEKHVPFMAFSGAVPGRATGAHIHIGPPSSHRAPQG
jgi:hypothetical protein